MEINYVDPQSLMVINASGKMRQLFVPFKVQVVQPTSLLVLESWVVVEEVQPHEVHRLLFRITGNWWSYSIFRISVKF